MNTILSWLSYFLIRPLVFWSLIKKHSGWENIPPTNYILVSNHLSHLDEPIVGSICTPRAFHFIGQTDKYTGFKAKLRDFLYWFSGTIPLDRRSKESGVAALKTAEKYLRQGDIIIMYPEGTRSRTGEMATKGKLGVAVLTVNTGTPVLPVAITGTYELNPPDTNKTEIKKVVGLKIGQPMFFHEEIKRIKTLTHGSLEYGEVLQEIADKVLKEIAKLKSELDESMKV